MNYDTYEFKNFDRSLRVIDGFVDVFVRKVKDFHALRSVDRRVTSVALPRRLREVYGQRLFRYDDPVPACRAHYAAVVTAALCGIRASRAVATIDHELILHLSPTNPRALESQPAAEVARDDLTLFDRNRGLVRDAEVGQEGAVRIGSARRLRQQRTDVERFGAVVNRNAVHFEQTDGRQNLFVGIVLEFATVADLFQNEILATDKETVFVFLLSFFVMRVDLVE